MMHKDDMEIIKTEIAPLVQNGELTLFTGAGLSIDTPTVNNLGVPSTSELIKRICIEAGYADEAEKTDLATAFGVGEDEIDNFINFLISNFTVKEPFDWQVNIFKHWWRAIFTTNIDTIPEACIRLLSSQPGSDFPTYQVFNYRDRAPISSLPTSPPIVYLHGMVSKPKEGFVFDNVSYAENTISQSDWLSTCSLHIAHGNCLFVGSKFKESDIEASLRRREKWDDNGNAKNWIVLRSFTELERRSYLKRGIQPIKAEADEFFNYLFSIVKPLTKNKFIKRKAPFLSEDSGKSSRAWFASNFTSITSCLETAKKKKNPFSLFFNGDLPNWFYIVNKVPAEFSYSRKLTKQVIDFEKSEENAKVIVVLGPLGSGKTNVAMQTMADLSKTHNNTYQYVGLDGINIEEAWDVIKDLKGLVTIFIDASSTYFYAINELIDRVNERSTSCKLCFILEERTIHYDRNKRHLTKVASQQLSKIFIENIDQKDAEALYDKALEHGVSFEKLKDLTREEAIKTIIDFENGYKGDLLATLYDLSSRKSYKEQLNEEYEEIESDVARSVFQTISLVTASRLSIPINYLCEVHNLSVETLMRLARSELKDKVHYIGTSLTMTSRHHSIAEFHLSNNVDKYELRSIINKLMQCLSSKFSVDDIKKHPISYKIYSKVLSYHYLTETLFKGSHLYNFVHDIYSECQIYFSNDGVFWLQYGRFLERDNKIEEALHCFRKGLNLYDSFQIRHALGQTLLKKFRLDDMPDDDEFYEGLKLLEDEIEARGSNDAYPFTALGNELIKIYEMGLKQDECRQILKNLINRGLEIHKDDLYFSKMISKYFSKVSDTHVN